MYNEKEVITLVQSQIPEVKARIEFEKNGSLTVYAVMQQLAQHVKALLVNDAKKSIKQCFDLAGMIYKNGTPAIKNAVSNVFVYSVSNWVDLFYIPQSEMADLMPKNLKEEYKHMHDCKGV